MTVRKQLGSPTLMQSVKVFKRIWVIKGYKSVWLSVKLQLKDRNAQRQIAHL